LRDLFAGIALFAATACVVLWQNAHVAILWDTSYVLDSAARFALGQAPYRHFPFVHPPLTFLIQAAIIRFTGRVFFHHVIYAAVVGGLATLLTWRLALVSLRGRISGAWTVALLLAAPLTVLGIYSIIPIPEYDGDCAFWILVALWLLQRAERKKGVARGLVAGVALCLPLFTKQNMGLPFLLAGIVAVLAVLAFSVFRRKQVSPEAPDARTLLSILAGTGATLFAAALALHWTVGIRSYIYWTMTFAGERRLPGFGPMLAVFRDPALLWTLPCVVAAFGLLRFAPQKTRWAQLAAFLLLAAPFLFTLASLLIDDDADSRARRQLAGPLAAAALARGRRGHRKPVQRAPKAVRARIVSADRARRNSGHIHVAGALGLHVCNLAAARAAHRGVARIPWPNCRAHRIARIHARARCSRLDYAFCLRSLLHRQRGAPLLRSLARCANRTLSVSRACRHGHAGAVFAGIRRAAALRPGEYSAR
jgi:hypothetical protein